jgi:ceramide glucosyltransferase
VIADSDLHVRPDYLERLAASLDAPGVGLVTTLYSGRPVEPCIPALLGATQITHCFLPGALLARAMGRRDCLGATMMLGRETLERAGGLGALVGHLADDNVLGRLVREQGLDVRLADAVVLTTVPETSLAALFSHELRWARTIRALVPAAFAASVLQYPIFWAALAMVLSGFGGPACALFALSWAARAAAARGVDRALQSLHAPPEGIAFVTPLWLLPLRDLMSVVVMIASYGSRRVDWRGYAMEADDGVATSRPVRYAPQEGLLRP